MKNIFLLIMLLCLLSGCGVAFTTSGRFIVELPPPYVYSNPYPYYDFWYGPYYGYYGYYGYPYYYHHYHRR